MDLQPAGETHAAQVANVITYRSPGHGGKGARLFDRAAGRVVENRWTPANPVSPRPVIISSRSTWWIWRTS